ncbi:BMC domain-containing protein [Thauera linaloolentis]|uniref:Carboxysome structural protein EutK n=1 Tax=Thauera linaloolentis (strain DSM 12138 / JCM 21573 / CCUG 41526 / CIP 105981 / IAM 15112 / NBRC 102519 / 47Lol) TaxID=1123367 RepID=N6YTM4_THAL4|nr:BMC domain-containing protein [Thauera linaloolentis]ENO85523.1 carboxysome structural protein EutK [Thauera linaloolentis 47Lol = DSM 12138]MCM8564760.1 BMC domain-containing protein [Thauera linaloolentis]
MKIDALGFLEVRGLVAAIEAADAMLKAADVKLIRQHQVDPRFITLVVEGDLAACRAAVDAGKAAAARLGEVVSRLEIGRPDADTETMVVDLVDRSKGDLVRSRGNNGTKAVTPAASATPGPVSTATAAPAADSAAGAVGQDAVQHSPSAAPPTSLPVADGDPLSVPAAAGADDDALVAYIAAAPRGCSLAELAAHFGAQVDRARLDALLAAGRVRKAGSRYRVTAS